QDQINILGDDGVPLEYHIVFNKSEVIDFVILQQDAFDRIDASSPLKRQQYMVNKVLGICEADFEFEGFEEIGIYFKRIINILRQMNYKEFMSDDFKNLEQQLDDLLAERVSKPIAQASHA
ncbi:MAG: V-type ATP synthase subunit A, partial [Chitinispirillaceae bacterium]